MRGTSDGNWADSQLRGPLRGRDHLLGQAVPRALPLSRRATSANEAVPSAEEVLGHFNERGIGLTGSEAIDEAKRCMSCGMCFECDNCVIFCPQDAVFRVKKDKATTGRYVDTDYDKCIGCHICADVCPTGYIEMALGH